MPHVATVEGETQKCATEGGEDTEDLFRAERTRRIVIRSKILGVLCALRVALSDRTRVLARVEVTHIDGIDRGGIDCIDRIDDDNDGIDGIERNRDLTAAISPARRYG